MSRERYSLEEVRQALGITKSGLEKWLRRANMKPTRDNVDMRLHWLSRAQVEHLAAAHRRTLAEDTAPDMQAIDAALTERIEALEHWQQGIEQRLAVLEAPRMPYRSPRVSIDASEEMPRPQNRPTVTHSEGLPDGWMVAGRLGRELNVPESTMLRFAHKYGEQRGREWWLSPEVQALARRQWGK